MSSDNLELAFGKWVQTIREEKMGLNIWSFAKKIGVDAGTISRLEKGHTQVLLDTAIRICNGTNMSPDEFIKPFLRGQLSALLSKTPNLSSNDDVLLTLKDIESFLWLFRQDLKLGSQWLINLLNETLDEINRLSNSQAATPYLFVVQNIEQLLATSPFYKFELHYPAEIDNELILKIFTFRGVLTPADAGIYVRNLRIQKQLVLTDIADNIGRSQSVLSRLEAGSIERIKLLDVLLMDNFYQQDGRIFALYWQAGEFNARIIQSDQWTEREAKIGSILVTIARWQQILNWDDQSWVAILRKKVQEGAAESQLEAVA